MRMFNTYISLFISSSGIHKLYAISFLWYTALGAIVTIVVGVVASLILRQLRRK